MRRDAEFGNSLHPLNSVLLIELDRVLQVEPSEVTNIRVGWKAFGLASIPSAWAVRYFVVSAKCDDAALYSAEFTEHLTECLVQIGARPGSDFMIRSSGVLETIDDRGRLPTEVVDVGNIVNTIARLRAGLSDDERAQVHWVVQEFHAAKMTGHLSNERRARRDKRDWLIEFTAADGSGYESSIAVRRWRDGNDVSFAPLLCTFSMRIGLSVKPVAMWAQAFNHRVKFEWFWDGRSVYLAQADIAEPDAGSHPETLLRKPVATVSYGVLECFHPVRPSEYESLRKLRNVAIYASLGYEMPTFFLLESPATIEELASGAVSEKLMRDLEELARRPLMLRTDGELIPNEKQQMLPRSDVLFSADHARDWLLSDFRRKVVELGPDAASIRIIAHNFIPSVASAWAWAAPGQKLVRIESLWGIPEGLYWYSYDTFEVDTRDANLPDIAMPSSLRYPHRDIIAFKGTFVAPNDEGNFIPCTTAVPEDWLPSVRRSRWLSEIAYNTRRIAEIESHPVSAMWLLDNHPTASRHEILPWYHSESDITGAVRAAPRNKVRGADEVIATADDWARLRVRLADRPGIERIVMHPRDPSIIRNLKFIEELGTVAAAHGIVVELSGGILSHAYHILRRFGARVECVNLVGASEDTVEFNKVVRDRVVDLIVAGGEKAQAVRLEGDALLMALKQKLIEESFEALDASSDDLLGELADILEVVHGICDVLLVDFGRVEAERVIKRRKRGGFDAGLMLTATSTPRSIPVMGRAQRGTSSRDGNADQLEVIANVGDLPMKPVYRKPDLRRPHQMELEKMLVIESELNRLQDVHETLDFTLPTTGALQQDFALTLEMHRDGATMRSVVRLRSVATQLKLEFSGDP